MVAFKLLCLLAVATTTEAASCGASAIPYSLEVMPGGETSLGCARPSCFGWNPNSGEPAGADPSFTNSNGRPDGFFRDGPSQLPPFDMNDPRVYPQQTAECSVTFGAACGAGEWVGGFENTSFVQCCSYPALAGAADRGVAAVNSGEIVIGGEVMQNGVQSHFDYISNVQKTVRADGSVGYDVSVGRFECMDIPGTTELFHGPSQPSPIFNQQPPQAAPAQAFVNQPQPQPFIPPQQNFVPQSFAQPAAAAAAPSYYYPYAAATSSYYCFTADTKVRVMGGSEKRMDELNKYDWVQSLTETEMKYVPVSFWLHRVPTQVAEFMKISLADGNELKITKSHFIYKTECSDEEEQEIDFDQVSHAEVTAGKVNKGDCLYTVASSGKPMATRVTKIETVTETGIYAPMTANGKVVVNGVHASCHSVVKSHALQNAYFEWAEYFQNKFRSLFTRSEENEKHLPFSVDAVFSLMSLAVPGGLKEL